MCDKIYNINISWISEVSASDKEITLKGKRIDKYDAPFYEIKLHVDDWDLKEITKWIGYIASERAKKALNFKQEIIDAASEGIAWKK